MSDKAEVLARLARVVAQGGEREPLASRLCDACCVILGVDNAAITLDATSTHRVTLCASTPLSARLEDLQDILGEGPGKDAYVSGVTVTAELDAQADLRWPMFAPAARDVAGDASVFAFPMRPGADVLGILTLYKAPPGRLLVEIPTAEFLSDAVGAALLREPVAGETIVEQGPWGDRSEIHQATGMVIAQLGIRAEDALALLRAHAFAHNTTLHAIAREVVERRLDFRGS